MEPFAIRVNGQSRADEPATVHTNLLDWLRDQGLTGAKEGCAEGECGACAVLVARPEGPRSPEDLEGPAGPAGSGGVGGSGGPEGTGSAESTGGTRWTAVNACLPPALALDGQEIVTAEGLGAAPGAGTAADLHPVQQEMATRGGSQCGYCTPGFVCAMAAEYYRPDRTARPGAGDARQQNANHDGELDREPGAGAEGPGGGKTSGRDGRPNGPNEHPELGPNGFDLHALSGNLCRCTGYRPIRDAAYALGEPLETDPLARRQAAPAPPAPSTTLARAGAEFTRPATMADLLDRYAAEPGATLLAGATDLGVEVNIGHLRAPLVLAIDHLPQLRTLQISDGQLEIGAALTLSEIERALAGQVPLLAELFDQFASRLIRNTATLGGNIATASPIGDAAPVLLALDAALVLASTTGERQVPMAEYFTGYRRSVRADGEVIRAVRIPLPLAPLSAFYKIAKRRLDDISAVAVAITMTVEQGVITTPHIGLGGVAATPIRATAAEQALTGRPWTEETARIAAGALAGAGTPIDDHRASARYRTAMLEQSLLRFFARARPQAPVEVLR